MKRASRRARPRIGRPAGGLRSGERVRDYPQISVRVPATVKRRVAALSVVQSKPQWRIVVESIERFIRSLSKADRRKLNALAKRKRR